MYQHRLITSRHTKQHFKLTMLLDLKQKQASVLEADYARQETAETTSQGKTLLAFATVTIIFVCSDAPCDYCF
jgi:hypothetical protein